MSQALDRIEEVTRAAQALLDEIKEGNASITLAEARELYSSIREAEGWLQSARTLLRPGEEL